MIVVPFAGVHAIEKSPYTELFNRLDGIWCVRAGAFKGNKYFPTCFFTFKKKVRHNLSFFLIASSSYYVSHFNSRKIKFFRLYSESMI